MCGGLLAATGARDAARSDVLRPARAIAAQPGCLSRRPHRDLCNAGCAVRHGRAQAQAAVDVLSVQRAVQIAANVFLLALAGSLVWRTGTLSVLQRAGSAAFAPLLRALRPLLQGDDLRGRVAMGLAWGLMPCALIYSVLPLALFAGGAWQGAAVMLGFGSARCRICSRAACCSRALDDSSPRGRCASPRRHCSPPSGWPASCAQSSRAERLRKVCSACFPDRPKAGR
jgi:hypothetical protein